MTQENKKPPEKEILIAITPQFYQVFLYENLNETEQLRFKTVDELITWLRKELGQVPPELPENESDLEELIAAQRADENAFKA